jgi:regulatory protein YycI of two-component signal transduction system YycFG
MNWETAKNWLIAAFLILDLILGWQVWQSKRELTGYVESYSDLLANTKTILAEHGFSLDTSISQNHPNLSLVHAELNTPPLADLAQQAFPDVRSFTSDTTAGQVLSDQGKIKVLNKGTWQVTYAQNPALSAINTDVLKYIYHSNSYAVDSLNVGGSNKQIQSVSFYQRYQSYPIFDASVTVQMSHHKLLQYTQTFVQAINTIGQAKPTISALDALNNLANSVDKSSVHKDNKILMVDLGYAHKIPSSPSDSSSLSAPSYWFPVWRIVTSRQIYYVNAFTGEVNTSS